MHFKAIAIALGVGATVAALAATLAVSVARRVQQRPSPRRLTPKKLELPGNQGNVQAISESLDSST